jgi:hypothetical protein
MEGGSGGTSSIHLLLIVESTHGVHKIPPFCPSPPLENPVHPCQLLIRLFSRRSRHLFPGGRKDTRASASTCHSSTTTLPHTIGCNNSSALHYVVPLDSHSLNTTG